VFDPVNGAVVHSGTATANPLTMVAGAATLKQLGIGEYDRLEALGLRLRNGAATIMEEIDFPGQVTGLASLFRIHLTDAVLSDYRSTLLSEKQKAMKEALYYDLLAKGAFIATSGMGCLSTPMAEQEIDYFLQALQDSLLDLKKQFL
jgi:glutamate-1-semialdehyde 2,1-aminomutase